MEVGIEGKDNNQLKAAVEEMVATVEMMFACFATWE